MTTRHAMYAQRNIEVG